jgi:hypothetical protein
MKINQSLSAEEIFKQIYDGQIGIKQFQHWLSSQLQQAYDKGVHDADAPPSYDDVSRSQYD